MKVPDLFVGRRLFVGCGNPVGLGIGPTEIRGSSYIEGPLMVGNPLTYPIAEANLMVARCINIEALPPPPSIFKVSTRGMPPTPIDVMLGDPAGHVGISVNSTIISIFNDTNISIISPYTTGVGILNWVGAKTLTGVVAETGAEARIGKEAVSAATVDNGFKNINSSLTVAGTVNAAKYFGDISACSGKKDFDIPHPTKDGWRLRHVCIEGPTADVYVRGKLKDSNVIDLPEYWRGLVDPETITINITPIGYYQELFVEKIEWGTKIIVKNNSGSSINCYYTISGERIDVEKNIPEYEGTYEDYPGDNSQYMNTVRFLPMEN
jgi:hypothetical protein